MSSNRDAYWLTPASRVEFLPSPTAPVIVIEDADRNRAFLHLTNGELRGETGRQDAIAVLDALAGAVMAAYRSVKAQDVDAGIPAAMHAAAELIGGTIPAHVPGAYPTLSCCGGPSARVQLVPAGDGTDDPTDDDDDAIAAHELVSTVGDTAVCARCGWIKRYHGQPDARPLSYIRPCELFVSPTAPVASENDLRALSGDR